MKNPNSFNTLRFMKSLRGDNGRRARAYWIKGFSDPYFPFLFLVRNLITVQGEPWWRALSPRSKKSSLRIIAGRRISFFRDLKEWKKRRGELEELRLLAAAAPEVADYCHRCGLCCEVSSGLWDFPEKCEIPPRWRAVFANGLGKGHRFCPFLWGDRRSGGSLCAVHPWRSIPCRLFESEECEYFWKSPLPPELTSRAALMHLRRCLSDLVYSRELPLRGTRRP